VYGVDNNMRKDFFGPQGDTSWNRNSYKKEYKTLRHHQADIRDLAACKK
jgi:CDP-paratose 2-epimerase